MTEGTFSLPGKHAAQLIKLPNRILEKIGGLEAAKKAFGPDVLHRIEQAIDDQAELFQGVIDQYVREMNAASSDSEAFDQASMRKIRDISHELRGIAGTFGFHLASRVAKSLWGFLGEFQEPNPAVYNVVRMHVDTLLAAQTTRGDADGVALQVEKGLQSVIHKLRASA